MLSFIFKLITPDGTVYESDVESLTVPGAEGYFGILPGHAPMVAAVTVGVLKIREEEDEVRYFVTDSGVLEVADEFVTMLVGQAIPQESAEQAKETAKKTESVF